MKQSQDQTTLMKMDGLEAYCAIDMTGHVCESSPNLNILLDVYADLIGDSCDHLIGSDSYAYLMQQLDVHGDVFDLPIYIYPQGRNEMKLLYVSGRRTQSANGKLIGSELYFSEHSYLDDAANSQAISTVKISLHGSVMSANSDAQTWLEHWREHYGYAVPERILHEALLSWAYQDEIVLSESALDHSPIDASMFFTFSPDRQAGVVSISMQHHSPQLKHAMHFEPVLSMDVDDVLASHVYAAEQACPT